MGHFWRGCFNTLSSLYFDTSSTLSFFIFIVKKVWKRGCICSITVYEALQSPSSPWRVCQEELRITSHPLMCSYILPPAIRPFIHLATHPTFVPGTSSQLPSRLKTSSLCKYELWGNWKEMEKHQEHGASYKANQLQFFAFSELMVPPRESCSYSALWLRKHPSQQLVPAVA